MDTGKLKTVRELYNKEGRRMYSFTDRRGRWSADTSEILSFLIGKAGKYCKRFASDLFISWQDVDHALSDGNYEGGRFIFAFRDEGVDGNNFTIARLGSPIMYGKHPYRAIYVLDIDVAGDEMRLSLKEMENKSEPV